MEKEFWRRITRDEIITDYNTKAVNVDAYQRRDNNSDTAGKVENETRQQMNNLFQRLCSVRSFLLSRKHLICDGQFSFSHRASQVETSPLLLDTFSKSSTFPWKNWQQTASWSFSWSLVSRYNRLSRQSFVRLYGAGPLATSSLAWLLRGQKSLPSSLRNSLNSIPRWFQWFSGALSSF